VVWIPIDVVATFFSTGKRPTLSLILSNQFIQTSSATSTVTVGPYWQRKGTYAMYNTGNCPRNKENLGNKPFGEG